MRAGQAVPALNRDERHDARVARFRHAVVKLGPGIAVAFHALVSVAGREELLAQRAHVAARDPCPHIRGAAIDSGPFVSR